MLPDGGLDSTLNIIHFKLTDSPICMLLLGGVCISLSPIFIKAANAAPDCSAFYRMLFTLISNYVWIKGSGQKFKIEGRPILFLSLGGFFLSMDFMCWHRSIALVGPGLATLLANLQVFFTAIFSYIFFKQRISWTIAIAIPTAFLGLILIVGIGFGQNLSVDKSGLVLGILAAFFYSGYILLLNAAMRSSDTSGAMAMLVVSITCTMFLGAVVLANGHTFHLPSIKAFLILACAGIVGTSLGWGLISSSMKLVNVTTASFILLLQPTLAFFWDVLLFSKKMNPLEILGIVMVLLAIYLGSNTKKTNSLLD